MLTILGLIAFFVFVAIAAYGISIIKKSKSGNSTVQSYAKGQEIKERINIRTANNLIILDTETTGLSTAKDEILQLSIVDRGGNVLFDSLIKPAKRKTWKSAEEIHGITPKMVKDCPTLEDKKTEIQDILSGADMIAGFNTEFDIGFLKAAGFKVTQPQYDLMKDFAPVHGVWNYHFDDWKYPKLSDCAEYFGYEFKAHNSLEDTRATLFCMLKLDEMRESGKRNEVVRENLAKIK